MSDRFDLIVIFRNLNLQFDFPNRSYKNIYAKRSNFPAPKFGLFAFGGSASCRPRVHFDV